MLDLTHYGLVMLFLSISVYLTGRRPLCLMNNCIGFQLIEVYCNSFIHYCFAQLSSIFIFLLHIWFGKYFPIMIFKLVSFWDNKLINKSRLKVESLPLMAMLKLPINLEIPLHCIYCTHASLLFHIIE